jgi:hypothetical protein
LLEELPAFSISPAVNKRGSFFLQLEAQGPEHIGGVRISFPEPDAARISLLQDLENLLTRPSDCVTVFAQRRQLQHNALVLVRTVLCVRLK